MREFSGIAEANEHTVRVSFIANVWHDAASRTDEIEMIGRPSYSIDGVECDMACLEEIFGATVAASVVDRAKENASA